MKATLTIEFRLKIAEKCYLITVLQRLPTDEVSLLRLCYDNIKVISSSNFNKGLKLTD